MKKSSSRLVYSTDTDGKCPKCGHPQKSCKCSQKAAPAGDGVVRVSRQTKGRKGSGVSLVTGVPLEESELKKLAKILKQKCGSGGTVKNGIIEIQGDHGELLVTELSKKGWNVKKAGG